MKNVLKLGAVVLAIVMVLSMSVTAFAGELGGGGGGGETPAASSNDTNNVYTGSGNTLATGVANGTTIPLNKSIVFVNANGSSVYEPNITYTYTVEAQNPGTATVTDNQNVTYTVNAGVSGGVYFNTTSPATDNQITFASTNAAVTALATGTEVEKSTNLSVDLSKFTHAGIYRYKITETTTAANKNAVGIVEGSSYDNTRYLDVYIANATPAQEGAPAFKMVGAVIFKSIATSKGTDSITAANPAFEKTTGFVPASTTSSSYSSDTTVDTYTTYDFTVKKLVAGTMADKTHEFPFYVNITNTINGAKYTYINDAGTSTPETVTGNNVTSVTKGSDASNSDLSLKNGETVKFVGLPSNTTNALSVLVKEWNNSPDQYTASVAVTNGTIAVAASNYSENSYSKSVSSGIMNPNATNNAYAEFAASFDTQNSNAAVPFAVKTNDVASQIITVTNTLSEISPTGVVLRVAPYALMLGVGLFLVLFSRRRKNQAEA